MTDKLLLKGTSLRYVLTMQLLRCGPQSVADLVDALDDQGFTTAGRPSKAISDALRWEMARGRVYRVRHGRYRPGEMPRSTEYRIRERVAELRAAAADLRPAAEPSPRGRWPGDPGFRRSPSSPSEPGSAA
ncbi:hypothetical protein ACWDTP_36665 [Mycobacterium sp. NPDC003449]